MVLCEHEHRSNGCPTHFLIVLTEFSPVSVSVHFAYSVNKPLHIHFCGRLALKSTFLWQFKDIVTFNIQIAFSVGGIFLKFQLIKDAEESNHLYFREVQYWSPSFPSLIFSLCHFFPSTKRMKNFRFNFILIQNS